MRVLIAAALTTVLSMWGAAAKAEHLPGEMCLSSGDATEAVAARKAVAPAQAILLAHRAVPDAEVLRAALCNEPDTLVYRIMVLRNDGRLVRVTVDAPSGKVKSVH